MLLLPMRDFDLVNELARFPGTAAILLIVLATMCGVFALLRYFVKHERPRHSSQL